MTDPLTTSGAEAAVASSVAPAAASSALTGDAPAGGSPGGEPAAAASLSAHPTETAAAATSPLHPAEVPSLLETAGAEKPAEAAATTEAKPADPAKPAEAKPEEIAKPAEAAKPAEPLAPEPIDYSKIEFPELIKPEGERHVAFTGLLQEYGLPAEAGSKLAKLAGDVVADIQKQLVTDQIATFNTTRQQWRTQIMADPEFGGSGFETSQNAMARMRDRFVSSAAPGTAKYLADHKEFNDFCRITGAGDHPVLARLLHNIAAAYDEPQSIPAAVKPPADIGRKPGTFKEIMYDHPRSQPNGATR